MKGTIITTGFHNYIFGKRYAKGILKVRNLEFDIYIRILPNLKRKNK